MTKPLTDRRERKKKCKVKFFEISIQGVRVYECEMGYRFSGTNIKNARKVHKIYCNL